MKKHLHHIKGYSLIEVLIAIAILMMSIVGPLSIAAKSIQTAQYARQQTTAFFLAQEGITTIEAVRNRAPLQPGAPDVWIDFKSGSSLDPCFTQNGWDITLNTVPTSQTVTACNGSAIPDPCVLNLKDTSNTGAILYGQFIGAGTSITPYTRTITLELSPTNADELLVTVVVRWPTTLLGGSTQNLTLRTTLFNVYTGT